MAWWCRKCWAENQDLKQVCCRCDEWITEHNLPYDQKPHPDWEQAFDKDPNSTKLYARKDLPRKNDWQKKQAKRKREAKKPFDFDW